MVACVSSVSARFGGVIGGVLVWDGGCGVPCRW